MHHTTVAPHPQLSLLRHHLPFKTCHRCSRKHKCRTGAGNAGKAHSSSQDAGCSAGPTAEAPQPLLQIPRRTMFLAMSSFLFSVEQLLVSGSVSPAGAASDLVPAILQLDKAPDQSRYNPADPDLREAAALLQRALNAETVQEEERLWSEVINKYEDTNAIWMPDVVGRAYGNRGNARSRQGKLAAALTDYNAAIQLCPWSVDPVINRGVVLEALGRWTEAAADYQAVLSVAPSDPSAWNNLGNTYMGMKNWSDAEQCFAKAAQLAPAFSFAAANKTLAMFQLGKREQAIREMRTLLRRYPDFPDMRAALAAAQWAAGREGDAETNWQRVEDPRYRDVTWLQNERRWPPALVDSLQAFLQLKSV
eukprot:GHUV01005563.1.p1 GENE.GHUV01005563.1~~GHUV01005563.1.p1  ORF type:complete len:364 (+),score=89.25 GHUV01005563.1:278-1369(+)